MTAPTINTHNVTSIKVDSKTISGISCPDFGRVKIIVTTEEGEAIELICFVDNRDDFKLDVEGIERGLHFI